MRSRPVLVYDGDCGFCTTAANFAERRVRPRCDIVPWQFTDLDVLGVTRERAAYEVVWVTPVGAVDGGARAVAKALLSAGGVWAPLGVVLLLPGVRGSPGASTGSSRPTATGCREEPLPAPCPAAPGDVSGPPRTALAPCGAVRTRTARPAGARGTI